MFLRYYCELPDAYEKVESRLLDDPEKWLPGLATSANHRGELLLTEVGVELGQYRVGRRARMRFRPPLRSPGRTVLPMTWLATGPQAPFPAFEGELEVAALGSQCTQLVISVNYRPPREVVGHTVDRFAMHRVAEATIKDFLDHTGDVLRVAVPAGPHAEVP
ncbi:MAG TPA: hypothetical protein VMV12_05195 [Candidatus Micrarchaeaceae archaeon]|nr:hypothetical protein [Candidatus Micrarchaeaceae archaeon]